MRFDFGSDDPLEGRAHVLDGVGSKQPSFDLSHQQGTDDFYTAIVEAAKRIALSKLDVPT